MHKIAALSSFNGDVTHLSSLHVKKNMTYAKIPDGDKWRIGVMKDMLNILNSGCPSNGLTKTEATQLLEYVCTFLS